MQIKRRVKTKTNQTKGSIYGVEIRTDFPLQNRPKFVDRLFFPDDVTELSAANISDLHGKYTKLYAYANQSFCAANIAIIRVDTSISLLRNNLFRNRPALNSLDRWRRDAVIEEDSQMEKLQIQKRRLEEKKELLQMFLTNYERYINALSRELSRKSSEREINRYG